MCLINGYRRNMMMESTVAMSPGRDDQTLFCKHMRPSFNRYSRHNVGIRNDLGNKRLL